jgi:hypothetical protein
LKKLNRAVRADEVYAPNLAAPYPQARPDLDTFHVKKAV